jgi:hypothetical protein
MLSLWAPMATGPLTSKRQSRKPAWLKAPFPGQDSSYLETPRLRELCAEMCEPLPELVVPGPRPAAYEFALGRPGAFTGVVCVSEGSPFRPLAAAAMRPGCCQRGKLSRYRVLGLDYAVGSSENFTCGKTGGRGNGRSCRRCPEVEKLASGVKITSIS